MLGLMVGLVHMLGELVDGSSPVEHDGVMVVRHDRPPDELSTRVVEIDRTH
jgi:hypothetical protein